MPLNLNSDKLIVVCKPDQNPITYTGYSPTIIVGSGGTTVSNPSGTTWVVSTPSSILPTVLIGSGDTSVSNVSGNTWIVFSNSGATGSYVPLSAFTFYTGTTAPLAFLPMSGLSGYWTSGQTTGWVNLQGFLTGFTVTCDMVTGCTDSLYLHNDALDGYWDSGETMQAISAATSGLTSSWSGLTGLPTDNANLVSLLSGYTLTGDTHQIELDLTGLTSTISSHTGDTSIHTEYSAITSYVQSQISGFTTGNTFTQSGSTIITQLGDNVNIYSPIVDLSPYLLENVFTGYTGQTQQTLTGMTADINYLSGVTDSNYQDLTGHTSNLTIHFPMSGISISESQVINLPTDLGYLQTQIDDLSAIQSIGIYYVEHQNGGIVGYESLLLSPITLSGSSETVNINANTVLFDPYITPAGGLGITGITSGLWIMHGHFQFNSTTGSNYIHWDMYKRDSGGTETFLFRMSTPDINVTTLQEYQIETIQPAFSGFAPTDRFVLKIYAQTTGGAKTATMQYASTTTYGFMQSPLKTNSNPLWSSIYGKPSWLSGSTLNAFESGHQHSQYLTGQTAPSWSSVTSKPQWLSGTTLSAFQTGHTHGQYLTGFTVTAPMVTGITDSLYLHADQPLFTGYTFTESGATQITQVGDNVNIYVPSGGGTPTTLIGSGNTTVDNISGTTWVVYSPTGGTGGAAWGDITGTLSGQTDLQTALDAKANILFTIKAVTGTTYTLLTTDSGKILQFTATGATTITIPSGSTFLEGFQCTLVNYGNGTSSGVKTIAAQAGATVKSANSALKLSTIFGACTIYKTPTAATWVCFGDLSA